MKKILFATTALVATAGFAAAEVTISGSAEIGVIGGDGFETQFHQDINVDFALSGESDNGISFGAEIGLEEAEGGVATTVEDDYTVFISAGGMTFTMGDTDGAFDKAMQEVALVGATLADDETAHAGYNGNSLFDGAYDGQIARLDYTFQGVTVSASAEMDDLGFGDPVYQLGVAYDTNLGGVDLGIGLGYGTVDTGFGDADEWGISVDAAFAGGFSAAINYTDVSSGGLSGDHWAIGVGYEQGPIGVGVNYGEYGGAFGDLSGWGLAAQYDFGGGLTANAGYGSSDIFGTNVDTWSLGLRMSF